ncbi:MAG: MFS transporter [Candidatus Nitrospinota bacterium M3_3B_026]
MKRLFLSLGAVLLGMSLQASGAGLLNSLFSLTAERAGFSTSALVGAGASVYFAGFLLGMYICPAVIRRVGHIRSFAAFAALASASAAGHGLVPHAFAWIVFRFAAGLSMMGLYMVAETWINEAIGNRNRGAMLGGYTTLLMAAMGLSQLALVFGSGSWERLFSLCAALFSLGLIPVALTRFPQPEPAPAFRTRARTLLKNAPLGSVAAFAAGMTSGAFWGLGAVYVHLSGGGGTMIAVFMTSAPLGAALLQWPIGAMSDRGDRRRVMAASFLLAAVFAAALPFTVGKGALALAAAGAFLYGAFSFSLYGLGVAHIHDYLRSEDRLGGTGAALFIFGAGAFAGPIAGGVSMDIAGPGGLMRFLSVLYLACGLYALYRLRIRPPAPEERAAAFIPLSRTSPVTMEIDPRIEPEEGEGQEGEQEGK